MSISIKSLVKTYGLQRAVDSISFELMKGEIIGFIGPNGSGKTTTMKCICGILPPDSGIIEIEGMNVQGNDLKIKKIIGYLPEHNPLYYDMFVKEYLLHVAHYYMKRKECNKKVKEIIEAIGLAPEQNKKIGQLSKGYKQRVGLAQALVHDPEVLILDEPTSGLDPNQIVEIRSLISGFSKDKTVLLSTHILQEVEAICDRIIVIDHGKIVADGSSKNIRQKKSDEPQTIYVEFSKPIDKEVLMKIPGVVRVEVVSECEYLFAGFADDDLREKIFNVAMGNKYTILTIQKKEETLEEAFRKLTLHR